MLVQDKQDADSSVAGNADLTGQEFAVEFTQGNFKAAAAYGVYDYNAAAPSAANFSSSNS
jgi:hypothetical protein